MIEQAYLGIAALGVAGLLFIAGIVMALRGDGTLAAFLIVCGAILTLAGAR